MKKPNKPLDHLGYLLSKVLQRQEDHTKILEEHTRMLQRVDAYFEGAMEMLDDVCEYTKEKRDGTP